MKNSSRTPSCRLETRRKEKQEPEEEKKQKAGLRNCLMHHCSAFTASFTFLRLFTFLTLLISFWLSPRIAPIVIVLFFFIILVICKGGLAIKAPYKHCNRSSFINESAYFPFLSLSPIFSHFLGSQTPSEDDNSEDEWLDTLPSSRRRLLGAGFEGN